VVIVLCRVDDAVVEEFEMCLLGWPARHVVHMRDTKCAVQTQSCADQLSTEFTELQFRYSLKFSSL
jgi:hypothetical protein